MTYMKKKITEITMLLFLVVCAHAQRSDRQIYIETYRDIAIQEMDRSGIPASIKLAQGILESGSGSSTLAKKANNHFGIKCGSRWTGKIYIHFDDDYDKEGKLIKSCFRKYKSARVSYVAHTDFLMGGQRYAFLFSYPKTDYKKWARGLKKAGYATNPKYADLLIGIIDKHKLHRFDKMTSEVLVFEPEKSEPTSPFQPTSRRQTVNNQVKVIVVAEGDTYGGLANIFNISMKRLLKYNDLSAERPLKAGDLVYTQPKRKKYRHKKDIHLVKSDDDMYSISQKYGIRLKNLYKRNRMRRGTEPATGERIYLRKKARHAPELRPKESTRPAPITKPKPPTTTPSETTKPRPTSPRPKPIDTDSAIKVHTVQKGDTLYGIARKYNMTVSELKQVNRLTNDVIKVGQQLKVK